MSTDSTIAVVADLASKSFDSTEAGLDAVLAAVQQILGYQTVLMSQIDAEQSLLRIHAVRNSDPALTVPLGLQIPLTASPCQHVASSVRPFNSSDMHADPDLALLPAAKDMGATAYLGVPVVLADGSFFGTLVGLTRGRKSRQASRPSGCRSSPASRRGKFNGRASSNWWRNTSAVEKTCTRIPAGQ